MATANPATAVSSVRRPFAVAAALTLSLLVGSPCGVSAAGNELRPKATKQSPAWWRLLGEFWRDERGAISYEHLDLKTRLTHMGLLIQDLRDSLDAFHHSPVMLKTVWTKNLTRIQSLVLGVNEPDLRTEWTQLLSPSLHTLDVMLSEWAGGRLDIAFLTQGVKDLHGHYRTVHRLLRLRERERFRVVVGELPTHHAVFAFVNDILNTGRFQLLNEHEYQHLSHKAQSLGLYLLPHHRRRTIRYQPAMLMLFGFQPPRNTAEESVIYKSGLVRKAYHQLLNRYHPNHAGGHLASDRYWLETTQTVYAVVQHREEMMETGYILIEEDPVLLTRSINDLLWVEIVNQHLALPKPEACP